ncbi:unnamed protein product [Prunus armeniaca]
MLDYKPADTPIVKNHKLGVYVDQVPTNRERYQRLVRILIYSSLTRPDIAYVVSVASQFMYSPSEDHMAIVMRILSYLKSAPRRGLLFEKNGHLDLEGYTDADYAGNITDRRSTSGYFTFVGGNLVTWHSKKQNVVSRSSAEFEYRGIAQGFCEILWLRWLLAEIRFRPNAATKLHCDNQSTFEIVNNPTQRDRTKHVEVDRHFIKEKLEHKLISIPFVPSSEQLADMLTHADLKTHLTSWELPKSMHQLEGECWRESTLLDDEPFSDVFKYHSVVGALQYLTLTCPNIAFVVNQPSPMALTAFSNADYAGDRKSIGGRLNTVNLPTQLVLYPNFILCLLTCVNLCLLLSFGVVAQALHVGFVASLDQIADVFTKGLSLLRFSSSISKLHFIPRSLCLRRGRGGRGSDKPKEATDSNTGK